MPPAAARPVRVAIADDQVTTRRGMVELLSARGYDVVELDDVARPVELLSSPPDVVVVDPAMEGGLGLQLIGSLVERRPGLGVVAHLAPVTGDGVESALDAGCTAVVPKSCSIDDLAAAVDAAAAGREHVHPRALAALLARRHARSGARPVPALSGRELDVVVRMADGMTNAAIARDLGVAEATVKTHVANLLHKLDAPDRAAAVATALRLGLFS